MHHRHRGNGAEPTKAPGTQLERSKKSFQRQPERTEHHFRTINFEQTRTPKQDYDQQGVETHLH